VRRAIWRDGAVLLAMAIALLLLPRVYQNQMLLFQLMVYLALSQGVNILYGFTGYLPFGYVGFFGVGAYGASLAMLDLHFAPLAGIVAGGVVALALGLLLSPLLRLSGAYFAIASLAASQAVYLIIANPALQSVTYGPYGIQLANQFDPSASYYTMLVVLLLAVAVVLYIRRSRFGMALQAMRDDPVSAAMAGVPVVRERTLAWMISAGLAGVVGGVFAWQTSVFYPDAVFTLSISIFAIVFALFGGVGTLLGPIFGTVVLFGMYNMIGISDPQYFQLIYGVLIVALVIFLPDGVASLLRKKGIHVL